MVASSSSGITHLSPQVSESLALDLGLFVFIRKVLKFHFAGDFSQALGSHIPFSEEAYLAGHRYCSCYEYQSSYSSLDGLQLLIVSPSHRGIAFVRFLGESL